MKVFISWSGETTKKIAEMLRIWLPTVIQKLEAFHSEHDITSGARWEQVLTDRLAECRVGIICLTPENIASQWVAYEAGALSRNGPTTMVCTLLFGMKTTDFSGPLTSHQATIFSKDGFQKLLTDLNTELGDNQLPLDILKNSFEMAWPRLEEDIASALTESKNPTVPEVRSQSDQIEEILTICRFMMERPANRLISPVTLNRTLDSYYQLATYISSAHAAPNDLYRLIFVLGQSIGRLMHRLNASSILSKDVNSLINVCLSDIKNAQEAVKLRRKAPVVDDDLPF